LRTPKGSLPALDDEDEDLEFGEDLAAWVGKSDATEVRADMGAKIKAALKSDERVGSVAAKITAETESEGLVTYLVSVDVMPEGETTQFTLTLSVSEVTVELLGVKGA
jgi:hypothetical protein